MRPAIGCGGGVVRVADSLATGAVAASVLAPAGIALLLLARSMSRGTLPLNRFVGIRTPMTLRSPQAWRVGHLAGARATALGGAAFLAGAASAIVLGLVGPPGAVGAAVLCSVGIVLAAVGWSWRRAVQAIRAAGLDR